MPLSAVEICDHLLALRASLVEDHWMPNVQPPVLALFNELVVGAKRLRPGDPALRAMDPAKTVLRPGTLRTLVDQVLVALGH